MTDNFESRRLSYTPNPESGANGARELQFESDDSSYASNPDTNNFFNMALSIDFMLSGGLDPKVMNAIDNALVDEHATFGSNYSEDQLDYMMSTPEELDWEHINYSPKEWMMPLMLKYQSKLDISVYSYAEWMMPLFIDNPDLFKWNLFVYKEWMMPLLKKYKDRVNWDYMKMAHCTCE